MNKQWTQPIREFMLAMLTIGLAPVIFAHHSQTQYDLTKKITIEGTLAEIGWSNPRTLFYIDVKRADDHDGTGQRWIVEGPNPLGLINAGWERAATKIGDKVTMVGSPRKDGQPELLLLGVALPKGKKITFRNDPTGGAGNN